MNRRDLIVALSSGIAVLASGAGAQSDPLATAFGELPVLARRNCQIELQLAGLYAGAIDGAFGKGTRAGLMAAAQKIAADGRRGKPDVGTLAGARAFLARLANGEFMNQLYDGGYEG